MELTTKCPVCGRAYKVFSHYAGDQTACRECIREAEDATRRPSTADQIRRRFGFWR